MMPRKLSGVAVNVGASVRGGASVGAGRSKRSAAEQPSAVSNKTHTASQKRCLRARSEELSQFAVLVKTGVRLSGVVLLASCPSVTIAPHCLDRALKYSCRMPTTPDNERRV
jgi:hypothetical protein